MRKTRTRPIIGINADFLIHGNRRSNMLADVYLDGIARAGGVPIIMPIQKNRALINAVLNEIDGLILSGGDDIHPKRYKQKKSGKINLLDSIKETSDFALVKQAIKKNMPTLGICYGMQLINVAFGGDLIQDLPKKIISSHIKKNKKNKFAMHKIKIVPKTRLSYITGMKESQVDSAHHQAIRLPGKDLFINATSTDGLIEGIEHSSLRFFVGLQWHPEVKPRIINNKIFKYFINECKNNE